MRSKTLFVIVCLVGFMAFGGSLLLLLLPGCATKTATNPANEADWLPNFRLVEAGVYRGGQPTGEGWQWLVEYDYLKTEFKLNTESEGSDIQASHLGVNVIRFPITFGQQIGLEKLDMPALVKAIKALPRYATYIHCEHGQDRTGLACAIWRVVNNGWSKADAEKEMLANGFHKELRGLWEYWEKWTP